MGCRVQSLAVDLHDGPTETYYVYGLDLISTVSGTTPTYYLNNGLGPTTGLADGSAPGRAAVWPQVTDTYKYDVFGAERSHTGSSGQPFRFAGEQNDAAVNGSLYYLRARYYDPGLGRIWSRDPWGGARTARSRLRRSGFLYGTRYDLEPSVSPGGINGDGDVDVKDIQFVFGRQGSTCANPNPPQPPENPKA